MMIFLVNIVGKFLRIPKKYQTFVRLIRKNMVRE